VIDRATEGDDWLAWHVDEGFFQHCGAVDSGSVFELTFGLDAAEKPPSRIDMRYDTALIAPDVESLQLPPECAADLSDSTGSMVLEVSCDPPAAGADERWGSVAFVALAGFSGTTEVTAKVLSDDSTASGSVTLSDLPDHVRGFADFDWDGRVDFDDFFLFADAFGSSRAVFDYDGSGRVDLDDFVLLFGDQWGQSYRR